MTSRGEFAPDRPNMASVSSAISFLPVAANVVLGRFPTVGLGAKISVPVSALLSAGARHFRRNLKTGLKSVDNDRPVTMRSETELNGE